MKKIVTFTALAVSALTIASCQSTSDSAAPTSSNSSAAETTAASSTEEKEVSTLTPRVTLSHDGGIVTLNAINGEIISQVNEPGFYRLNQAGDGRHLMVTHGDEFAVYDSGNHAKEHGDHYHYYESQPHLTDATYPAEHAGHVVHHDDLTALFADGSGDITVVKTEDIANPDADKRTISTGEPHHGVAVPLEDGSIVHTVGTEDERHTIRHVSADGKTLAETTDCPGIHGEAVAEGEALVFGCTNGPVVFSDGEFHKIPAEGYQRSGNLAGSEESPIVLGDNKVDKDAKHEHPESVLLINSADKTAKKVDLGATYWFRSLGRGPEGEALVLTNDGKLVVIDEETGEITNRIDAIQPWEEKEEWQQPGPILKVSGSDAYITDAENNELVVVDLKKGEVSLRHKLDFSPVEMEISTGKND
ncbi:hypothetical protein [Corynebacterium tapiri]|uniref:PQQ-like beta-propeller repeat protein n=1 Tax=Corynebacterium tapiri TaxID=1448266 RepID=A0A5C4U6P8_9CORY|nr:hypothetical protein [Corynebacterium tapiri]TNM00449.1 hypothetical protein FHE74_00410 [Corynebacterium tapiri]